MLLLFFYNFSQYKIVKGLICLIALRLTLFLLSKYIVKELERTHYSVKGQKNIVTIDKYFFYLRIKHKITLQL